MLLYNHTHKLYKTKSGFQCTLRTLGMIMFQRKFINGNKCTTLMSDAESEVGSAWRVGQEGSMETVLSPQICYEPKTSLKNQLFKYFKEIEIIVS